VALFHNESLRKKLYNYIKQKIKSGELKPGELINQKEISEELGISRTPYRDCMIQLESEGLVNIIPCRGVAVREQTLEEIIDAQEIGAALEGMAHELAFSRAKKYVLKHLAEIVEEVGQRLIKGDVSLCHDRNMDFHMLILRCCPNKDIVTTLERMRERIYDFHPRDLTPLLKWEKIFWEEHKEQVEILKHGTPRELADFTRGVHWNVTGKEGYWEAMFNVPHGTVRKYFNRRETETPYWLSV